MLQLIATCQRYKLAGGLVTNPVSCVFHNKTAGILFPKCAPLYLIIPIKFSRLEGRYFDRHVKMSGCLRPRIILIDYYMLLAVNRKYPDQAYGHHNQCTVQKI